jgi:hypothetical protein
MRRACITLAAREFNASFSPFFGLVVDDDLPPPLSSRRTSPFRPPRPPVDDALVDVPATVVEVVAVSGGGITSRTLASSSDVVLGNGNLNIDIARRRASSLSKSEFVLNIFDNDVTFDVANTSYADKASTSLFDTSMRMSRGPSNL